MTQDQNDPKQGTGDIVSGEVVTDDGTDESPAEQATFMTHFRKVAASPDALAGHDAEDGTSSAEAGAVSSPEAGDLDDQNDPDQNADQTPVPAASTVTTPDDQDHADTRAEPGEADLTRDGPSDLANGSLLPDASEYRQRWQQVQFRFVDDPHGSVAEAADVIAQVTAKLEAAIAERQRSLRASWSEGAPADTETLRATLLTYRAFLDQLTGAR